VVVSSALCVVTAASVNALPAPVVGLAYGPSPYETLSVYPAASPGARLVIVVHGGGWTSDIGSYGNTPSVADDLQAAGFAVVVVNYNSDSLSEPAFPTQPDELELATTWVLTHAVQYNGDPTNLSLVGLSAGGQLVAQLSQMLPQGTVKTVVTLSGAFDFTSLVADGSTGAAAVSLSFRAATALGCRLATCNRNIEAEWSPAAHVTSANCPAEWLIYNSADELMPMDQPSAMAGALSANGCNVTETIVPGTAHAWYYWGSVSTQVINTIEAVG